jgi:hypothetical protein
MESPELQSAEAFVAMMRRVLDDVMARPVEHRTGSMNAPDPVGFSGLEVCSFRQTWPDASCGFGGIAAQVLTDAQTVVLSRTDGARALVYIRGEFAYTIERPNQTFWDAVRERQLPGAADPHTHLGG